MYNAMYPTTHAVHLTSQATLNEGRHFSSSSGLDLIHIMDGEYAQRKEYFFPPHGAINFSHNGSTKHVMPPSHNGKTYYNTSKRENWSSRNQNKPKRLNHVISAPCIPTALTEESGENGTSRSNQNPCLQNTFADGLKDDSSDKSSNSDCKIVTRLNEIQNQKHTVHGNNRNQQRNERRNEVSSYPKRRMNNYPRSPPMGGYRTRRMNNIMINVPSPFPPNSMFAPFYTAPDRFLHRAHLMEVKHTPEGLNCGSIWDQLSQAIWKKFITSQQTEETYRRKMGLWKCLYVYIKTYFPKYGLYLVGSTMSGFGSECSDVDMCLLIRHVEVDQRSEAISYLSDIYKLLEHCDFVEKLKLIQAKVPLLKFRDCKQGLQVDLNCNNSVGIRNTHLLYCYGRMDWRVKPLIVIVKLWAQWHNINDAKNMTISSYSLALMVIHFLQCGVSPKVLPCLHSIYKEKFNSTCDISTIDIHEELEPYFSNNKQPLGELLLQFFQYYASFDFMQYAISVRCASIVPIEECRNVRSVKNDPHHWKYLCIEEPFDLTNTAKSVYNPEKFEQIRHLITTTAHTLMHTRNLESIFKLSSQTG
ncbi:poly(A) RNA polymerase gld-2 homolog A-like isoform X2 [Cimex lectularius]|uniref:Uncharacterized protein n=1 Tax=Cimex lectularius TaxID=79782 RepID=A0A8I6RT49_CIMLE|nr:poly(A) RNA polymerase gld-2 homolog A-like isoform X2 [Cimex lectularius]